VVDPQPQGLLVYPCHPYRQGQRCPHGNRVGCWQRHDPNDPRLGEPLCPRCYQVRAQVLWNALAGRLWSRTTIYLYRTLAKAARMSEAELRRVVRISFAKVAEYQKRGAVHFHAIIRLDARSGCSCPGCVLPPPEEFTAGLLEEAVKEAAATAVVRSPMVDEDQGVILTARWGEQLDVRNITRDNNGGDDGADKKLSAEQVAGYVAKYATKSTEALGVTLDHRIGEAELEDLHLPAHVAELVRACFELGSRPTLVGLRLRKWAHMLGFGGHFSTKSRRYSTTLGVLRRTRAAFAARRHRCKQVERAGKYGDESAAAKAAVVLARWRYLGFRLPDRGRGLACLVGRRRCSRATQSSPSRARDAMTAEERTCIHMAARRYVREQAPKPPVWVLERVARIVLEAQAFQPASETSHSTSTIRRGPEAA
jgi:hypothetical protein